MAHEWDNISAADFAEKSVDDLRAPILRKMLLLTAVAAWVVLPTVVGPDWRFVMLLGVMVHSIVSLGAMHYRYWVGATTLIAGLMGIGFIAVAFFPDLPIIYFFALLVAAAVFLFGAAVGLFCALIVSAGLALLAWQELGPTFTQMLSGLILVWLTCFLVWIGTQPMRTLAAWSLHSYVRAQRRTSELQDYHARLGLLMKSLDNANQELVKANRKLELSRAIAEEARRSKAEFVANVSHELRTPINMITGFTELILYAPRSYGTQPLPPALLADLDVVLRNAKHLSELIDDILDLSQLDVGRMAMTREWVDVSEVVRTGVEMIRPLALARNLEMHLQIKKSIPHAFIDKTRIRQVILNLLSNAVRFTEEGRVTTYIVQDGDHILISVEDTGPGIAPEDMPKLFEPFRQLDGSLRRKNGGTGLGLHISRSFVMLHGGDLTAVSRLGQGTTFCLTLPIQESVEFIRVEDQFDLKRARRGGSNAEFLVVEPRPVIERLLRRYLPDSDVVAVDDIAMALNISRTQPTRAIVLRASHAHMTQELLEQVNRAPYDAPIIVCSMPGLPEVYTEELGLAGYLLKPINRAQVLQALKDLGEVRTLLLVDDDRDFRQLFVRMLRTADKDYIVWQAESAAEALALLNGRRPDALFLDVMLSDTTGIHLLDHIRGIPELCSVPVFFITAQDASGKPMVATSLDVTHRGGLSADELMRSIVAIGDAFRGATRPILSGATSSRAPGPQSVVHGAQVCVETRSRPATGQARDP